MSRRVLAVLCLAVVTVACQATPGATTRTSGRPNPGPSSAAPAPSVDAGAPEPGVVKGVVTDEQGDPIVGAEIRLTGYTDDFTGTDENLVTDEAGVYRAEVRDALFDVVGTATIDFDGNSWVYDLRPADGDCEPQRSSDGVVKNLVLELSGIDICDDDFVDPDNNGSYNGGTVTLLYGRPRSLPADSDLEFIVEPVGALADGSAGEPITFNRTAAALESTFGPLDQTTYLYDIPLGRYRISGTATLPDGRSQQLRFATNLGDTPVESVEFGFEPYLIVPFGIRPRDIVVVDAEWQPGL
jgi:hypothetical protein